MIINFINSGLLLGMVRKKDNARRWFLRLLIFTYMLQVLEDYRFLVLEERDIFNNNLKILLGFVIFRSILFSLVMIIYNLPKMKRFFYIQSSL